MQLCLANIARVDSAIVCLKISAFCVDMVAHAEEDSKYNSEAREPACLLSLRNAGALAQLMILQLALPVSNNSNVMMMEHTLLTDEPHSACNPSAPTKAWKLHLSLRCAHRANQHVLPCF